MHDELLFSVTVRLVVMLRRVAERNLGIRTCHEKFPLRFEDAVCVLLPPNAELLWSTSPETRSVIALRKISSTSGVTRCVSDEAMLAVPSSNGLDEVARSCCTAVLADTDTIGPFRKVRAQLNRPDGQLSVLPVVSRKPVGPWVCS